MAAPARPRVAATGTGLRSPGRHRRTRPGRDRLSGRERHRLSLPARRAWAGAVAAFALQYLALTAYSWFQWHRGGLGVDFAEFNQAAWLIHSGDLAPYSTVLQAPFVHDHFSLLMWPIGLLYGIYPHGLTLLWLQDLWIVGLGAVGARFVIEVFDGDRTGPLGRHLAGTTGVFVAMSLLNPWLYTAASFDFHFEALAGLFLALAARSAWHRRLPSLALWSALGMLSADYGALYLFCLGLGLLLAAPRLRAAGGLLAAVALGWLELTRMAGSLSWVALSGYGYLISGGDPSVPAPATLGGLLRAALVHPGRWWHVLWERRVLLYQVLAPTGLLGLLWPRLLLVGLAVFGTAAVLGPEVFLQSGFQYVAGYGVALPATFVVLGQALRRVDTAAWARRALAGTGAVLALQAVLVGLVLVPRVPGTWIHVNAGQAAAVRQAAARVGPADEVVAQWGVEGRFSGRRWLYPYQHLPQAVPVRANVVDFAMAPAVGIEAAPPADGDAAITFIETRLHARVVFRRAGVTLLRWRPPRALLGKTVTLEDPGAAPAPPAAAAPAAP